MKLMDRVLKILKKVRLKNNASWKHYTALFLLLIVAGLFTSGSFFLYITSHLPSIEEIAQRKIAQTTKFYDRTGTILLYESFSEEKRTIIPFNEIPDAVKKATLAIEDENFYQHKALDWKSLFRALLTNLAHGKIVQGGSTITQQLVKNAFLSSEKSITRKIQELVLATKIENNYSKDEILGFYFNQIPYGSNAYGIEAASQTYFNKSAKDLNLAEAATLAALPKAPTYYSPYGAHLKDLLQRKNIILDKLLSLGMISQQQQTEPKKLQINFSKNITKIQAPHFVMAVQDYLIGKYGEDFVRTSGLNVKTTIDMNLQAIAEKSVSEGAKRNEDLYEGKNSALVAQDPKTGQILALVGSRDYFDKSIDGNFNVAVQGLRQPGSALKPFAYLALLQKGFSPDSILFDTPTEFDASGIPGHSYQPNNFDNIFRGPIVIRNALAQSVNIPAIKTLYLVGMDNFLSTVKKFGITTLTEKSRYGLSLILGGGEVHLTDLVEAYSVLSQEGIKHAQNMILEVKDHAGNILESYTDKSETIIDPQYPRLINDILSDVEARKPLYQNSLSLTTFDNQEVALKTGTTNDYRDAWSIGYTPSLVAGVWAGNNDNTPMQKKGSSILAAVPIWSAFMKAALKTMPPETFTKPEPVVLQKPMLNGQYILGFLDDSGNTTFHMHSELFYINKNDPLGPIPQNPYLDPQFENWEKGVLDWGSKNIPNFDTIFNKTASIPYDRIFNGTQANIDLRVDSPHTGDFVIEQFPLQFKVLSPQPLLNIIVILNGNIIDTINFTQDQQIKDYTYTKTTQSSLNLQNILVITATDTLKNSISKNVIIYKK